MNQNKCKDCSDYKPTKFVKKNQWFRLQDGGIGQNLGDDYEASELVINVANSPIELITFNDIVEIWSSDNIGSRTKYKFEIRGLRCDYKVFFTNGSEPFHKIIDTQILAIWTPDEYGNYIKQWWQQ